jgi:hypothetical protein
MAQDSPKQGQLEMRALRHELLGADDEKFRRIIAVLDNINDPSVNQTILDPLRTRLASLKPVRPLRFIRLLFFPLDPLIVQARDWRPGDESVPRTVLASIGASVQAKLGGEVAKVEQIIAAHKTDQTQAITVAGAALWSRAAEILAVAPVPADWEATGLRLTAYPVLAQAIAAVLKRASRLRSLMLDEKIGALTPDIQTVRDILRDIASEPAEGCAMIVRLILVQSPHATPLLRQIAASSQNLAERSALQQAVASGLDKTLHHLDSETGLSDEIGRAVLAEVGDDVRRISAFLSELDLDTAAAKHRPRLAEIRQKLDKACRSRFAGGLTEGLVMPLAVASGPMDAAGQTQLETCARDLRTLETAARKVGGAVSYDKMLLQASEAVRAAAGAGTLSVVRRLRLTEILAGSEAAIALYDQPAMA